MSETGEISLTRQAQHPEAVKDYMKTGTTEKSARDLVARDLTLERVRRDVQKEKAKSSEAERLSLIDSLTGLPNRRALFGDPEANPPLIGRLEEVFSHSERNNEPFTVAMLDLDHFKQYNDEFGHPAGDIALRELALVIRRVIRHSDSAFRYGGEEFAIILPDTDREHARILIERLRQEVERMPFKGSKGITDPKAQLLEDSITISAGLADYGVESDINGPKALIKRADDLLYKAKQEGRNRIEYEKSS